MDDMSDRAEIVASSHATGERASAPRESQSGKPSLHGGSSDPVSSTPNSYICDDCGEKVFVGQWFKCPHGQYKQTHGDLWYTDHNIGPEPITFRSAHEVDVYAKQNNLEARSGKGQRWI